MVLLRFKIRVKVEGLYHIWTLMTASMVDGDEKGKRQPQKTCLMFIQKGRLKTCISSFQTTFNPSVSNYLPALTPCHWRTMNFKMVGWIGTMMKLFFKSSSLGKMVRSSLNSASINSRAGLLEGA